MKICSGCNIEKPLSEFSKNRKAKDGLKYTCKACDRENHLRARWQKENPEKARVSTRKWDCKNKSRKNAYAKRKWREDLQYRLRNNLRRRITKAIECKKEPTLDFIGCSLDFYMDYLASKFDEHMSLNNYGNYWEIDHIIPLNRFDLSDSQQIRAAFHYNNTHSS